MANKEKVKELKARARRRGMNMYDYCLMTSAFYETVMRKGVVHEDIQNRMWYGVILTAAIANFLRYKNDKNYQHAIKQIEKVESRTRLSLSTLRLLVDEAYKRRTKSVRLAIIQELVRILAELAVTSKDFDPNNIDARVKS